MKPNPYLSPSEEAAGLGAGGSRWRKLYMLTLGLLYLYPTIAMSSIYLCCLAHGGPLPSGARLGEYDSLDEALFTLSVPMIIAIPLLAPLGLLLSFIPAFLPSLVKPKHRLLIPALILLQWGLLLLLVRSDPGGIITWYLD